MNYSIYFEAVVSQHMTVEAESIDKAIELARANPVLEWEMSTNEEEWAIDEKFTREMNCAAPLDIVLEVSAQDFHTVIAALRFYQELGLGDPRNRSDLIHDLGEVTSLDSSGIDDLINRLEIE